ncbi:MAG TPA: hypothetical protein PKC43_04620 [Phycisphaerales bacterium]|nr:hypothetical protein [Phycisphaerales bacterium]HMP36711.1 hypothetical protein [Phycisphaerales bacterium]
MSPPAVPASHPRRPDQLDEIVLSCVAQAVRAAAEVAAIEGSTALVTSSVPARLIVPALELELVAGAAIEEGRLVILSRRRGPRSAMTIRVTARIECEPRFEAGDPLPTSLRLATWTRLAARGLPGERIALSFAPSSGGLDHADPGTLTITERVESGHRRQEWSIDAPAGGPLGWKSPTRPPRSGEGSFDPPCVALAGVLRTLARAEEDLAIGPTRLSGEVRPGSAFDPLVALAQEIELAVDQPHVDDGTREGGGYRLVEAAVDLSATTPAGSSIPAGVELRGVLRPPELVMAMLPAGIVPAERAAQIVAAIAAMPSRLAGGDFGRHSVGAALRLISDATPAQAAIVAIDGGDDGRHRALALIEGAAEGGPPAASDGSDADAVLIEVHLDAPADAGPTPSVLLARVLARRRAQERDWVPQLPDRAPGETDAIWRWASRTSSALFACASPEAF